MAYKLVRILSEGGPSPALDGVPFPTGVDFVPETPEDKIAAKLLRFIDGARSVRALSEELPLSMRQLAEGVCRLYELGAIAFEPAFCDLYLVEDDEGERGVQPAAAEKMEERKGKVRVEVVEEGNLEEVPLWQRFNQLERKLFTGRILVRTERWHREFFFLGGTLSHAVSDNPEEDVGKLLLGKKKISEAHYQTYAKRMAQGGGDPFRLLAELGAFPDHQRLMAQRWVGQVIAFNALAEKRGTFVVERWEELPRDIPRLGLNLKGIMARFMAEVLPIDEEAEKLKEKMDWWLIPVSQELDREVAEKERRLWEAICERPRRLRDLMAITTMYKKDTYRFILTLLVGGLVDLSKHPPVEEGPLDLRRLDEIVETLEESHYFDVLAVHPISNDEDIKKAYTDLIKKFDPSQYVNLTVSQKEKLRRGAEIIENAWSLLKDETTRREYRKKTFSEYQLRQYAQLQFQKGEIYLLWRQNPGKANEYFRSAMDLDPTAVLYWAAVAYSVLSMSAPSSKDAAEAISLIEKVASSSTLDSTALVLAGGAAMRIGRRNVAEALFERAQKASSDAAGVQSLIKLVVVMGGEKQ